MLVAAAYLDEALEELLVAVLVDDIPVTKRLLDYPGGCSSLAARCDLTYCMGLIGKDVYEDIRRITKIRNQFAHSKSEATFEKSDVANICRRLNVIMSMERAGTEMRVDDRTRFLLTAGAIIWKLQYACGLTSHLPAGPSLAVMKGPEPFPYP